MAIRRIIVASVLALGIVYGGASWPSTVEAATVGLVVEGTHWRYQIGNAPLPEGWNSVGFDDSGWALGESGFGYGDGDDATVLDLENATSLAIRHTFTVSPGNVARLTLSVVFDDGYACDLNGIEVARDGVESRAHAAVATQSHEHDEGADSTEIAPSLLNDGTNVLACQGFNRSAESSDLSLSPTLTAELNDTVCLPASGEWIVTRWENLPNHAPLASAPNVAYAARTGADGSLVAFAAPAPGSQRYGIIGVSLADDALNIRFRDLETGVEQTPVDVRLTQIAGIGPQLFQDGVQDIANSLGIHISMVRNAPIGYYAVITKNGPIADTDWWVD